MQIHVLTTSILIMLLSGCLSQHAAPTPKLQHALLAEKNSSAVGRVIAQLLHSPRVQLADDVFTINSTVTLDRLNQKDLMGNPIMGKQLNMPDQFELMIKANHCFIRHLDSKATQELKGVVCKINE